MVSLKDRYNRFISQCSLIPTDNQMLKINQVIIKDKQKDIDIIAGVTFKNCYDNKSRPDELPNNLYEMMGIKSISIFDVIEEYEVFGNRDGVDYSATMYIRITESTSTVWKIVLESNQDIEAIALDYNYTLYSFNDIFHRIREMLNELPPSLIQDIVHEFGEVGGVRTYVTVPYRDTKYNSDVYTYIYSLKDELEDGERRITPFLDLSKRPVPFDLFGLAMLGDDVNLDK